MKRIRWLIYLPVLLWMAIIFWFSANDGYASALQSNRFTYTIVDGVNRGFNMGMLPETIERIVEKLSTAVRKCAHFTEYMILAMLLYGAVRLTWTVKNERGRVLAAIGMAVLYASFDELHQMFVAGRNASLIDVLIDAAGATAGSIIVCFVCAGISQRMTGRKNINGI